MIAPLALPSPAIVPQSAVRRLPRWALWLLCLAYVLPGFVVRGPWKTEDIRAFGYMLELASGRSAWLTPTMMGLSPEVPALLPYWLGAWAIQAAQWLQSVVVLPEIFTINAAARFPFIGLLFLTLMATWRATYSLALQPQAQPVAFAFGGEAKPKDYARTLADGALLALMATWGLAQLGHEATAALAQLAFSTLAFYGVAALPFKHRLALVALPVGLMGLSLSGAATLAVLFGLGSAAVLWMARRYKAVNEYECLSLNHQLLILVGSTLVAAGVATALSQWRWILVWPSWRWLIWRDNVRQIAWFAWPAWPLVVWTLWRWRGYLRPSTLSPHLALPLWYMVVCILTAFLTPASDHALLLALPAMACMAAFALPTLRRRLSALIDWFTLLFFTFCGLLIWMVYAAILTGTPSQVAVNVSRLVPGVRMNFAYFPFGMALLSSLAWFALVRWRTGRHRNTLWKSLVLPAGGTVLCWVLLLTLLQPLWDYVRSYEALVQRIKTIIHEPPSCMEIYGLNRSQMTALRYHGEYNLVYLNTEPRAVPNCPWLIVDPASPEYKRGSVSSQQWKLRARIRRPTDKREDVILYSRLSS